MSSSRAKRIEQHIRQPVRRGTPRDTTPANARRWSPEGRVRTAIKTLATADRAVVQAALREVEGVADIVIKRVG